VGDHDTLALVGKTNVLTHVYDLWERVFHEIGERDYPEVRREYYHVDGAVAFGTQPDASGQRVVEVTFQDAEGESLGAQRFPQSGLQNPRVDRQEVDVGGGTADTVHRQGRGADERVADPLAERLRAEVRSMFDSAV
jgi:hypothetical protein